MPFSRSSLRLHPLFLSSERRVHLEQAFGQVHAHFLALHIHLREVCLRERNFHQPCRITHNQQRRFARPELNIFNASYLAAAVKQPTTYEIADIIPCLLYTSRCV